MKTLLNWSMLVVIIVLTSCQDDQRGQYPIHSVKPSPIARVLDVTPFSGGAKIYYELPNERDWLYVMARYTLDTGQEMEVKISKFESFISVDGFRDEAPRKVELRTVDRSQNESEPLIIWITPKRSPIYGIIESLVVKADFGGIKLLWENVDKVPINIFITVPQTPVDNEYDVNNDIKMRQVGQYGSTASKGSFNIRGFDSEPQVFGIQIRDRWGNYTELQKDVYTPRYEERISNTGFVKWNGDPNIPYSEYSSSYPITKLWDNDLTTMYHTKDPTITDVLLPPKAFTFDMGRKVVLSRFKLWHRSGDSWAYSHNNPKEFLVYGSNHPNPRKIWDESENPEHQAQKWVLLGWFDTPKPSGLPLGSTSAEDRQLCQVDGIDYVFEAATEPFRYYRFDVPVTWSLTAAIHIAEARFWGEDNLE